MRKLLAFALLLLPLVSGQVFYKTNSTGSAGGGSTGAQFRIIVIQDTQHMFSSGLGGTPDMMRSAVTWIVANNPAAVLIVGDVVDGHCLDTMAWDSAGVVYAPLIASGIPYVAVTGNHDGLAGQGCADIDSTFDLLFNTTDYESNDWYGGNYGGGTNAANTFSFITIPNGQKFILIGLEFFPRAAVVSWAESLLTAYPNHTGILVNHDMMWNNGWSTNGLVLYDSLKSNENLDFFFAGHFDALMNTPDESGQPHWQKSYSGGTITTMLANWQNDALGGSGIIYIVDFDTGRETVRTRAYSPHFDSLLADSIGTMWGRPTGYTLDWTPFEGHY